MTQHGMTQTYISYSFVQLILGENYFGKKIHYNLHIDEDT